MPDCPGDAIGPSADDINNVVMVLPMLANSVVDTLDWGIPMITYLRDHSVRTDRSIQRINFKYVIISDELLS